MTIHLGDVPAGSTLYIPFTTYDKTNGASVTMTGLAVTDIEIYRNGSTTQRASDAGYTLLDTDGIDFDGITGLHGFSIDLNDNTDAGFYAVGSFYWVVVSTITIDSQTVTFVPATFRIRAAEATVGYPVITPKDDSITAASFDESTAHPLKSADAGSTAVARTGADSDTLKDISDEIAGIGAGSTDWTADEREQIRDALGVTGDKTAAVGGQLQDKAEPGDEMLLTAAYDAAKTAAQAGDKMDLVDAPNATAVTAIQAGLAQTGADADTLETLSDQMDALAIAGAGAGSSTLVYTVTDADTGLPIADVKVWATTDIPGNNIVAGGRTSLLGVVTLYLDAGTYYVWRRKSTHTFDNPQTAVVT